MLIYSNTYLHLFNGHFQSEPATFALGFCLHFSWKITFGNCLSVTCFCLLDFYPVTFPAVSECWEKMLSPKENGFGLTWKWLTKIKMEVVHSFKSVLCFMAMRECCCFVVVYSNAAQEHLNTLLYTGFVEELVDILELKDSNLTVSFCNLSFYTMHWPVAFSR